MAQRVYLDTAILLRVIDGKIPRFTLDSLHERQDVLWVFSPAHYDDVVASNPNSIMGFQQLLATWPRQRWILAGNVVPQVEVARFLSPDRETAPCVALHPNLDSLIHNHPSYFSPSAQNRSETEVLEILRVRSDQKVQVAKAETYSQEAAAHSRKPDKLLISELREFIDGDVPSPRAAKEWAVTQEKARAALDELEAVPEGWTARLAEQRGATFGVDAARLEEMLGFLPEMLRTIAEGDLEKLRNLQGVAQHLAQPAMAITNPLRLPLGSAKMAYFTRFLLWLPDQMRPELMSDHDKLGREFERWIATAEECPGSWVLREVEWQMHLDRGTPAKASDQTDLMHIALLPYVDVLFADKRVKAYLDRTDVPEALKARCRRNSEFEAWAAEVSDR